VAEKDFDLGFIRMDRGPYREAKQKVLIFLRVSVPPWFSLQSLSHPDFFTAHQKKCLGVTSFVMAAVYRLFQR
jgi:hypothetical protein